MPWRDVGMMGTVRLSQRMTVLKVEAAPNTLFLTVPKLLCPTPAGCSASGWNGGQRDGGCIAPDTGLLSLKYGGLLRRKEGHFSHVYYSHHFGDSLS